MIRAREEAVPQILSNEGHVVDMLLLGAIRAIIAEASNPLTPHEIAAKLYSHGFPAGNLQILRAAVLSFLREHREIFKRESTPRKS